MKIIFKTKSRHITIGETEVLLPHPISQVLEYNGLVLVRLHSSFGDNNLMCYDSNGSLRWISKRPDFYDTPGTGFEKIVLETRESEPERVYVICRGRPFYLNIQTGETKLIPNVPERM